LSEEDKRSYKVLERCPSCSKEINNESQKLNLLLATDLQVIEKREENKVYLRPETCQGIFTNFPTIQRSTHRKLPFGIGQIGKSFRNEITLHHGIFRTREFEQMELEFFSSAEESEKW
jgi:glycyl-tRNA synthetase